MKTEIFIDDIPPEGMEIDATGADSWLFDIIREAVGEAFSERDRASLHLKIHKTDENVSIDGEVGFLSHPPCDRCLVEFDEDFRISFHTLLAPLYESRRQQRMEEAEEVELVCDDLEFSFYEGDRIYLEEIVREQILLNLPMKHLCSEGCKGLCQRCGKDLNSGPCGCEPRITDTRWDALKGVKIEDKGEKEGLGAPKRPRSKKRGKKG